MAENINDTGGGGSSGGQSNAAQGDVNQAGSDVAKPGWESRVADNGRGTVWQRPGATTNADMVRVMEPTNRYPNGYVRFYNSSGQPLDLLGKPGPNSATHIGIEADGSFQIPLGW